jgi:hypothetical protein
MYVAQRPWRPGRRAVNRRLSMYPSQKYRRILHQHSIWGGLLAFWNRFTASPSTRLSLFHRSLLPSLPRTAVQLYPGQVVPSPCA